MKSVNSSTPFSLPHLDSPSLQPLPPSSPAEGEDAGVAARKAVAPQLLQGVGRRLQGSLRRLLQLLFLRHPEGVDEGDAGLSEGKKEHSV